MAFTGTPVVVMISERKARITGLSLAFGATGTIGLNGNSGSPGVRLPAEFQPQPYQESSGSGVISLQDSIHVEWEAAAAGAAVPIHCSKAGTTDADFLATLQNDSGGTASPELEIIVEWH